MRARSSIRSSVKPFRCPCAPLGSDLRPDASREVRLEGARLIAPGAPQLHGLIAQFTQSPLFRGMTTAEGYVERMPAESESRRETANSEHVALYQAMDGGRTAHALHRMAATGTAFTPLLWGFRVYHPGEPLFAREVNTIAAFRDAMGCVDVRSDAPLILCDIHAQHNGIPAAYYEPYYRKVAEVADALGVPTLPLSEIYRELGVTLEEIEESGRRLVQKAGKPEELDPSIPVTLPADYWARLKGQARHTVDRFPGVFGHLLEGSKKVRERRFGEKAQHYAQFRASEGVHVLSRLEELGQVRGAPVLPVHIADPNSGLVAVSGLFINAVDDLGRISAAIPWGGKRPA